VRREVRKLRKQRLIEVHLEWTANRGQPGFPVLRRRGSARTIATRPALGTRSRSGSGSADLLGTSEIVKDAAPVRTATSAVEAMGPGSTWKGAERRAASSTCR
jgi:hypothetical protein